MWRESDSWFALQFNDGTAGWAHLDTDGNYLGVFSSDGTPLADDAKVGYTCVNDNAAAPAWYTPPQE